MSVCMCSLSLSVTLCVSVFRCVCVTVCLCVCLGHSPSQKKPQAMHLKPHLSHAKPSPYTLLSPYTTHPSPNNTLDPKPKTLTLKPNLNVFVFQISTRLDQRIQPPSRLRPQASIYFIALHTHTRTQTDTHTHTCARMYALYMHT